MATQAASGGGPGPGRGVAVVGPPLRRHHPAGAVPTLRRRARPEPRGLRAAAGSGPARRRSGGRHELSLRVQGVAESPGSWFPIRGTGHCNQMIRSRSAHRSPAVPQARVFLTRGRMGSPAGASHPIEAEFTAARHGPRIRETLESFKICDYHKSR